MQIENTFMIDVPIDEAWPTLLDVQRIAPCFPGASVEQVEGDTFAGRVKVKLGPVQMTYAGTGRFLERDAVAKRAVIEGAGKDTRGTSTAKALVTTTLLDRGERTEVTVVTDFSVTGKPAQFGRGVMQDVSAKLVTQFAAALSAQLAEAPAGEPESPVVTPIRPAETEALDLMDAAGAAVARRIAVPATALVVVLLLGWRLLRRR